MMTRNDAYKAAKRAWKFWARRGIRNVNEAYINAVCEARVNGANSRDIALMSAWFKAFRNGRRLASESDLQHAERTSSR